MLQRKSCHLKFQQPRVKSSLMIMFLWVAYIVFQVLHFFYFEKKPQQIYHVIFMLYNLK